MRNLPDVINWRRLDDRITLSGQPTEEQLTEIRDMGVAHVINLGQHTNKGTLDDEPGAILALGTEYIYIPVDFENRRVRISISSARCWRVWRANKSTYIASTVRVCPRSFNATRRLAPRVRKPKLIN